MSTIVFDTLQYAKRAQIAGFTKEQAEFQAEEMARIIETEIATKKDFVEIKKDIEIAIQKLTIRIGGMLFGAVGLMVAIMKVIGH